MQRGSAAFTAVLFVSFVAVFGAIAAYVLFGVGYLSPEAAVRAGIAGDLVEGTSRGREAAICSVWWTPVPTIAQLVFAGIPGAVESGLAACLLSALGGAVLCVFIARVFLDSGFPRGGAAVAAAVCGANPWVLVGSAGGGSRIWVFALVTAALFYFRRWTRTRSLGPLVSASVCLGLLPVIEHQAAVYVVLMFLAALLYMVFTRGFGLSKIEGTVLMGASPAVYLAGLWFLFNWLIMGNGLHFLGGVYIEPVEAAGAAPAIAELPGWLGGWFGAGPVRTSLGEMLLIAPLLAVGVVLGVAALVVRRKLLPLVVFALAAAMPLFHAAMADRGQSFARHEDLVIAVPLSLFLVAHGAGALFGLARDRLRRWPVGRARWVTAPATGVMAAALLGSYATVSEQGASMPVAVSGSGPFLAVKGEEAREIEAIKESVEAKRQDIRVAVIGFEGYRFMRAVSGDERFLHYVNWDFGLINHNTRGKRLYLLVPKPEGAARFDDVNVRFPALYEEADVRLDLDEVRALLQAVDRPFDNWRLIYATRYYPPTARAEAPTGQRASPARTATAAGESARERPALDADADEVRSSP